MSNHDPYNYQSRGLLFSVVGHVSILLFFVLGDLLWKPDFGEQTVYSITLEGGSQLGGMSQLPKKDNKEKPAPPKPIQNKSEEKPEVKDSKVKDEKKEVLQPEKDAEVSTKVDPQPTVKPQPTAKTEPTKKVEKKEDPKKQETPKPKEKPTKDPKQEKADNDKEYQKAMQRYLGESSDAGGQGFGAGKIGGQGMGGGEIRPPEFFTYRDLIKRTVKKNWSWFDTATSLRATVTFSISPQGELDDVSIVRSSGNSLFDNSVIRAVLKSSPLPPPPATVYQWFKVVRTEFDPQE